MPELTRFQKICFAIGGIPQQMTGVIFSLFFQIFLLYVAQLSPGEISIILFVGRGWDVVSDPFVGWLVTKTPYTRYGRFLLWIGLTTPFTLLNYIGLWTFPESENLFYYFLILNCLFNTLQTCFRIPYVSLTVALGQSQEERNSMTMYRMTLEIFGMLLGSVLQILIVGEPLGCTKQNVDPLLQKFNFLIAAIVSASLYLVCILFLLAGIAGKEVNQHFSVKVSDYKYLFTYKPYLKLVSGFLFTSTAILLMQEHFILFCHQIFSLGENCQGVILTIVIVSGFFIPIWHFGLKKFGPQIIINAGIALCFPCVILMVSIPPSLFLVYLFAVTAGISSAAVFFLPWALLPDIILNFITQQNTNSGVSVLFYSGYIFFTKLFIGFMMALSALFMQLLGFETGRCIQSQTISLFLKLFLSLTPISFLGLGLFILNLKS